MTVEHPPSHAEPTTALPGYQLLERLGEGAYGAVYRARQRSTGQDVAVKLSHKPTRDPSFRRETALCANLRHPHIVRLIDQGESLDDRPFAVFEYLEGESLQEVLRRSGPLAPAQAIAVMGQALDALAYAHRTGIVHRDIKPANIMVRRDDDRLHATILDFGSGAFLSDREEPPAASIPPETPGTPSYASPEQLRGEPADHRSDLYSWGLVCVECLTGAPVMSGANLAEIIHRQLLSEETRLPDWLARHQMGGLLRRVLAKRTADRAADASRLLEEFRLLRMDDLVAGDLPTDSGATVADETSGGPIGRDLRPVTAVCCCLGGVDEGALPDAGTERARRETRNRCVDIAARYGGRPAGELGGFAGFLFGLNEASDQDARLATRFALDLAEDVRAKNRTGATRMDLRAGLHAGLVRVEKESVAAGAALDIAIRLAACAPPGRILLSGALRDRLERRVSTESVSVPSIPGIRIFSLLGELDRGAEAVFPIVGRELQLEAIREAWSQSKRGSGRSLLVQGEAGIGKSALVGTACREFRGGETFVLETLCLPEHRDIALRPVLGWLRRALDLDDLRGDLDETSKRLERALARAGCDLATALPVVADWMSLPPPAPDAHAPIPPARRKEILFDSLERLLLDATDSVTLLVLEDLHWADPTTLEFVARLSADLDGKRALLVATARREFDASLLPGTRRIPIAGLAPAEARELLERIVPPGRPFPPELRERILERAGGSPLFVESLVKTILPRLARTPDVLRIDLLLEGVPEALMDLLGAQVQQMGAARETAQLASVIGREGDRDLLEAVTLLDREGLRSDLDALVEAGILVRKDEPGAIVHSFRHALLRDAAYLSLSAETKRELHGRVAAVLEARDTTPGAVDPGSLAHHLAGAGRHEAAVRFGIRAATERLGRTDLLESIRLSMEVLDWIERCDGETVPDARLAIHGVLTQALMGWRGWADPMVREQLELSRRLLDQAGESPHFASTLCNLMTYHYVASNRKELRCVVDELSRHAERTADLGLSIAARTFDGLWSHGAGLYRAAEASFEFVLANYRPDQHGDHGSRFGLDTRVWSAATLALVKWFADRPEDAVRCADDAVAWAKDLGHAPSIGIALLYKANLCQYRDDRDDARRTVDELNRLAEANGLAGFLAYGQILEAWLADDSTQAEGILESLAKMGCTAALSYYRSLLADIHLRQGRVHQALACLDECLALCGKNDEFYYESELFLRRGHAQLLRDPASPQDAREDFLEALSSARARGMALTERIALKRWEDIPGGGASDRGSDPDRTRANRGTAPRIPNNEKEQIDGWSRHDDEVPDGLPQGHRPVLERS
jgi:TOMM system kinase/cyclase fusion protein